MPSKEYKPEAFVRVVVAAQFLFCKIGDQVWGGLVEFMLR
jgi:hypothetical protein